MAASIGSASAKNATTPHYPTMPEVTARNISEKTANLAGPAKYYIAHDIR
tara:strand:- start:743 stop:892 length:150 start_codon:yes stop_codon:yes gene_type:complete